MEVVQIIMNGLKLDDIKLNDMFLDISKDIFKILKIIAHKTSENKLALYDHMGVWLNFLCKNVEV